MYKVVCAGIELSSMLNGEKPSEQQMLDAIAGVAGDLRRAEAHITDQLDQTCHQSALESFRTQMKANELELQHAQESVDHARAAASGLEKGEKNLLVHDQLYVFIEGERLKRLVNSGLMNYAVMFEPITLEEVKGGAPPVKVNPRLARELDILDVHRTAFEQAVNYWMTRTVLEADANITAMVKSLATEPEELTLDAAGDRPFHSLGDNWPWLDFAVLVYQGQHSRLHPPSGAAGQQWSGVAFLAHWDVGCRSAQDQRFGFTLRTRYPLTHSEYVRSKTNPTGLRFPNEYRRAQAH